MADVPFSAATALVCSTCGDTRPLGPHLLGCERCRDRGQPGALAIKYRFSDDDALQLEVASGFWGYHRFLPVSSSEAIISLGEGTTPLLPLKGLPAASRLKFAGVKLETVSPTLSYKDRTNAVAISVARQFGFDRVCCTSSGNHGVSVAAYAGAAGLRSLVLFPPDAPPSVVAEVRQFGGEAVIVDPRRGQGSVLAMLEQLHTVHGWFISNRNAPLVTERRFGNPFGLEGYKTIAYELWRQLERTVPTWCFVPVGGGDGIAGIWRGFKDLVALGLVTHGPRMVACQPEGGDSIVEALRRGLSRVEAVKTAPTIALSLVDSRSGDHALHAVRESNGEAIAVSDQAIREALDRAGQHGVVVEPSSAAALAGFEILASRQVMEPDDTAVVIGTGAGLRWPATYERADRAPVPQIAPNLDALQAVVDL